MKSGRVGGSDELLRTSERHLRGSGPARGFGAATNLELDIQRPAGTMMLIGEGQMVRSFLLTYRIRLT